MTTLQQMRSQRRRKLRRRRRDEGEYAASGSPRVAMIDYLAIMILGREMGSVRKDDDDVLFEP